MWKQGDQFKVVFLVFVVCLAELVFAQNNEEVNKLFDNYFEWKLRTYPEWATTIGYHEYDHMLEGFSTNAIYDRRLACQTFKNNAETLMQENGLSELDINHLRILQIETQQCYEGFKYNTYYFTPINALSGLQVELPNLFKSQPGFDDLYMYKRWVSRLRKVAQQVEEVITLTKNGPPKGITYAQESFIGTDKQFAKLKVSADDTDFYKLFDDISSSKGDYQEIVTLQRDANILIQNFVQPRLRKLENEINSNYIRNLRFSSSIRSLQNGQSLYEKLIEYYNYPGIGPEDVYQLGLKMMKEIMTGIENISAKKGETNGINYIKRLRRDTFQKYDNEDVAKIEIMNAFRRQIRNNLSAILPDELLFRNITDRFNSKNLTEVKDINKIRRFEETSLALQCVFPGQMLLNILKTEDHVTPNFIKYPLNTRYESSPARPSDHMSFREGWKLYSQFLGQDLGLYENDDLQRLGYYASNLVHSAMLVIDPGIHFYGWSTSRAKKYLEENTALGDDDIEEILLKVITLPGYMTAAKIGQRKIRELRTDLEQQFGRDNLNLKQFHKTVLLCQGALSNLERCVKKFYGDESRNLPLIGSGELNQNNLSIMGVLVSILIIMNSISV